MQPERLIFSDISVLREKHINKKEMPFKVIEDMKDASCTSSWLLSRVTGQNCTQFISSPIDSDGSSRE